MTELNADIESVPDWNREIPVKFWDPGRKLLKSIRNYQAIGNTRNPLLRLQKKICVIRHIFWSIVSGADIPLNCQIGGGLMLPHPNGVTIHPRAVVGVNCLFFQQVTLAGAVVVGGHVDIGAGAKILGPLKLGNHAVVGANAVVTKDVAEKATVVGIPAKTLIKVADETR